MKTATIACLFLAAAILATARSVMAAIPKPQPVKTLTAVTGEDRAHEAGELLLGRKAPSLKLKTIDGATIDLGKLYGKKPIYLKFWATWCAPCLQQMPHFKNAYERQGDAIQVLAVNTNFNETLDRVKAYRDRQGLKMPIVIDDGRLASALNLRVTPQHIVIDRAGHIVYVGHLADAHLDAALAMVGAGAIAPSSVSVHQAALPGPANTLTILGGRSVPIGDRNHRQDTGLLFFSPWCEGYFKTSQPAAAAECRSARLQTEQLAKTGKLRWVGVASGLWATPKDLGDYRDTNRVGMPLSLDAKGDVFRAYHVTQIPTVIVIGPDGRERRRLTGDMRGLANVVNAPSLDQAAR